MQIHLESTVLPLAAALLWLSGAHAQQSASGARPKVITAAQYKCLKDHLPRLAISRRGNTIDLSTCPPSIIVGAFPVPPGHDHIYLKPADVACLRSSTGSRKVAVSKPGGLVALYLQPCGQK